VNLNETLQQLRAQREIVKRAITVLEELGVKDTRFLTHTDDSRRGQKSLIPKERGHVSERPKRYWASRRKTPT
jgi:hypothetical protein